MRIFRLLAFALASFAPAVSAAELTLSLVPRWGQETLVVPAAPVKNTAGQTLRVTRFALLVSGVALQRADGGVVRLDGQYGFIDRESGRDAFVLRGVPAGDYTGIEFQLGLAPDINHADPGKWPAGHALNPLVDGLHWSWKGGYVFLALEGRWREAGVAGRDGGSEAERGFSYHLAEGAGPMPVRFAARFHVADRTAIDFGLDLARVLGSRRLSATDGSESTHSAVTDTLAPQLATAMARAVFWLEAREAADAPPEKTDLASASASTRGVGEPFAFVVPRGFPQPELPADNALTVEGIALGRALFADPRLSGNGTQSCASCHATAHAFGDTVALSRGAEGQHGRRNAMPLLNLAWSPTYAWDGSQPRIRDQALAAWTNPIEMHGEPTQAAARLARDLARTAQFRAAFGSPEITPERITLALEQYLLTLVAADSRFDRAARGEAALTEEEKRGFELFMTEYDPARGQRGADCFHCHGGLLFGDFGFKDNGLDLLSADAGRAQVTAKVADRGKFKTPSLRNVAVSAPYMHDGRFATLEAVVAHYDHGVQRSMGLDPNLAKHPDAGLALSADDQRALVAFLKTLTDTDLAAAQ